MKRIILSSALILSLSLAACNDQVSYSPQEILETAMQETSELSSYYAEYTVDMGDEGTGETKHWEKNGKIRVETTDTNGEENFSINDGTSFISYTKSNNTAIVFELGDLGEGFEKISVKEQALRILEIIKNSHDITVGQDEKIAGHDTYHLIAKAKKPNTLIGDMEIWVDKKTWMTLKSVSKSGGLETTIEFQKFEPNAKIDDALFVADLPEDAIIQEEKVELPKQLTLEEATEKLGSFLIAPKSTGYTLESIEDLNVSQTNEIALRYFKNEEPQFTVSVFKPQAPFGEEEERIEVRGQEGTKMDMEVFRLLQWDENGLRYNIIFENPALTYEEVLELTEQMELTE
ncbi:outer membrane lipoprotein carrier protein LolA [Solibacillus sp. FSL W8-0474]|uniref:LolA family protein n=1 Tax=Solibacillus sp. FSL W8-0474 TaxID=2975336 RepID=UPI0030F50775